MAITRTHVGFSTKVKILEVIREHVTMLPDAKDGSKLCRYHEGWSDQRVAEEVGEGALPSHVMQIRKTQVGKFYVRPNSVSEENEMSLGDMEERVSSCEERIHQLTEHLARLEKDLGVKEPIKNGHDMILSSKDLYDGKY